MVIPEDGHLKVDRRGGCRRVTLNPSSRFRFDKIETARWILHLTRLLDATGPTSLENALVYWQAASPDSVTASTELPLTMAAYVCGLPLAQRDPHRMPGNSRKELTSKRRSD
jgi:hypothetical protein